ncbi:MAG: hypothetical protein B6I31_00625 [Desulfobacteraceae bacterium 4572_19]|nr:MAG: hypothetical protein B6I31_00625 [Desulfobacteraceae bacterium 4572_19]
MKKIMSNAVKGALLSSMVFPGLGQIVLKHYKRGIALGLAVTACFAVVLIKIVQQTLEMFDKIDISSGRIDINVVADTATKVSSISNGMIYNTLIFVIIILWVYGTVDAYLIGKKKDDEKDDV